MKTENVLVTSWNWLYLTDYSSSFKKTYLPEDNPADFSYYFDTSGRRTCYLAPERFLAAGDRDDGRGITWAMDIFSAGCVIAELFLEAPIFNLSQLYKYRKGEYDPEHAYISKLQDKDVREMVSHMIQLEPESRYSAEEYLNFWRRKAFPEYFYSFLHQYIGLITDSSSGRSPVLPESDNFGDADERINRMYHDFDKISYFLGYENERAEEPAKRHEQNTLNEMIPVLIDLPKDRHQASSISRRSVDDGSLIFLALVVSSIRNTARSSAKVKACDLMLAFAERITDEAKLDRVLPYVVAMLNDKSDVVKIAAIRTMTQVLSLITVVSPVNANVFGEYIRPRLQQFTSGLSGKASPLVRATYASCLASLAQSSLRILDMVQALRSDGSIPTGDPEAEDSVSPELTYGTSFDIGKLDLYEHFEAHTKALLTDSNSFVRRAFLGSVSGLCIFFGSARASDVILSHLNTYLNDRDWILKCAFFHTIVGVATFVGGASLEKFILPLMIQALTDPEEFVVERVLSSLASMAQLGLFQRSKTWEMVDMIVPFVIHPNIWIREAAAHFISASSQYLSVADLQCIVTPLLHPYLKNAIFDFAEVNLLDALKKPLPRPVLEMASMWATKVQNGAFWQSAQHQGHFLTGITEAALSIASVKDRRASTFNLIATNEEDEQWIKRLRKIGMTSDDESKLISLREFVWRVSSKSPKEQGDRYPFTLNQVLPLKSIDVTPQTIFFESPETEGKVRRASSGEQRHRIARKPSAVKSHTIADALLDASTTIEGSQAQRKSSHARDRNDRITNDHLAQRAGSGSRPSSLKMKSPLSASTGGRQSRLNPRPDTGSRGPPDVSSAHSDGTLTPGGSIRSGTGLDRVGSVKHKASAITLLNRRDTSKTLAETGTSSANVMGKMDGPFTRENMIDEESLSANHQRQSPIQAGHSYDGKDPNVLKLLNSLAIDNYPNDITDFGPMVVPAVSKRHSMKKADSKATEHPWRPERVLIATFGEHQGPINRVLASPDHAFFITGSDDGTTKIWDSARLERNLTHRSRQTLNHAEGAKVRSLCFVQNTHTFVSAADDGSIKVAKVNVSIGKEIATYGKLQIMRDHELQGQHAVWLEHSKSDVHSTLFIATNASNIIALDLRTMKQIYTLANPLHHGTPTCFCVDPRRGWLLVGTSHGILDLWDLRFHLLLKAWGLAGATPIHRVLKHPFRTRGKKVYVVGGTGQTDITIWDLEKSECCEAFRVSVPKGSGKDNLKPYEVWRVDDETPEGLLGRFASAIDPARSGGSGTDLGIRALAIGVDSPDDNWDGNYGYLVTGGADKKLRFWDQVHVEASMVISGLEPEEDQPKFSTSHPTPGLTLHTERASQQAPSAPNAGAGSRGTAVPSKKTGSKHPRNTVISLQQQSLLRNHLDTITDVCMLKYPVGMTVSVDRMGCIYVYQ